MDGEAANKRRRLEPKPHLASLDFMSSLLDNMLLIIIGLLPTKFSVQTTLLSRRGRPLWRHVPLNLTVDSCLYGGDCKCMAAVSKILSSHPGQPDALTSACSVPTARFNPSLTSGSYPPP